MKAMILAAGRGERMRPLTDHTPKPLLKVGEHRLIEYQLHRLVSIGIREVVINISYLSEQILEALGDGQHYGLKIQYSVEKPSPLETGGGIFQALEQNLLDEEPFILLSGDVWSELPLQALPQRLEGDAHLILVDNPLFHPEGDFGLKNGFVTSLAPKLTYANIAVINPQIFKNSKPGCFKLGPMLHESAERNLITGEHYRGPWFNLGTLKELEELEKFLEVKK